MMWQPIETAPRDGRKVRLQCPAYSGTGSYAEHSDGDPAFWRYTSKDIGWSLDNPPSEWMPLPPPPATGEDG
jgi:hypothetical protein